MPETVEQKGVVKSMLGTQVSSAHESSPSFGFGSSTREQAAKVFLSSEHAKLASTSFSPGPAVYMLRSTIGTQPDGRITSAPQWAFGTSDRFRALNGAAFPGPGAYAQRTSMGAQIDGVQPSQPIYGFGSSTRDGVKKVYLSEQHSSSLFTGANSPGPATYTLNSSVGKQGLSPKLNQPSWLFGSCPRFQNPALKISASLPSPTAYTAAPGVGPQTSSTKRSAPMPGFGTSNRAHVAKMFLSPEHEKVNYGVASPGPLTYLPPKQGKTAASYGFGTCDRWYTRAIALRLADTPSPSHYNV